jgi:hypothetical protein
MILPEKEHPTYSITSSAMASMPGGIPLCRFRPGIVPDRPYVNPEFRIKTHAEAWKRLKGLFGKLAGKVGPP